MPDVKLKKHHTHAGRKYPAGATIRNLRQDQVDWLEGIGVAEPLADTAEPPEPQSESADDAATTRRKTAPRAKE